MRTTTQEEGDLTQGTSNRGNVDPVLARALAWASAGRRVALATVTRTWGSAPLPAGSHMAIRDDGSFVGAVSGGCVESAVISEAIEVAEGGGLRTLEFGVTDEMAWEVGLACGGRITIFLERIEPGEMEVENEG